jgi:hypothetical protein
VYTRGAGIAAHGVHPPTIFIYKYINIIWVCGIKKMRRSMRRYSAADMFYVCVITRGWNCVRFDPKLAARNEGAPARLHSLLYIQYMEMRPGPAHWPI